MDHNQAGGQKAAESINFGDLMKAEGKRRLDELEHSGENEKQSFEGENEFDFIAEVEKKNCL